MSPLLAQSGHLAAEFRCPLLGVKRTLIGHGLMSAFDPKRISQTMLLSGLVAGHILLSSYRTPTPVTRPHMCSQHRTERFGVARQPAGTAPKQGNVYC